MTYRIACFRNGVDVTTDAVRVYEATMGGAKGFKPYKTRAAADRYCETLNAHARRHAPLLRPSGVVIEYRVVEGV